MRFPAAAWARLGVASSLAMAFVGAVCLGCSSSTSKADGCAPTSSIVASGTVEIEHGARGATAFTRYTLSKAQATDLFNEGALTVMAGDADSGPGSLDPKDPVALLKMDPTTDEPGTYGLDAVHAQVAYCEAVDAKLVISNGAVTGCAPSGKPVVFALSDHTLTVMSATNKTIDPGAPSPGGPSAFSVKAQYGNQAQACN